MIRMAAVIAGVVVAGCGGNQQKSDWERRNIQNDVSDEATPELPAYPRTTTLIEFPVGTMRNIRFYVDTATLSVGTDGIVRYVLVARGSGGAENVSFEGLRCRTAEHKRYAVGRSDGTWRPVSGAAWRPHAAWHAELQRDYFCPQTQPIRDADEGAQALRDGGHAFARGLRKGAPLGR
jgi:hypothetical protein